MKIARIASTFLILTLAIPALGAAATQAQPPAKKSAPAAAAAATHATTGVVKSMDASSLVITRPSAKGKEMTFEVTSATQQKGTVAAGASVQVRYRTENKKNIATAITVQAHK